MTLKRNLILISSLILSLCALSPISYAQEPDLDALLVSLDSLSNFDSDLSVTMTMEIKDPEEGDSIRQVQQFRRDNDDAFLMLIQKPETRLGQGHLRVDDNLWFYDPESRQFSYSSASERFQGSSARNSDFGASRMAEDYRIGSWEEGQLGNFEVWILGLEAVHDEVTFPFRKVWIEKSQNLLLKSEDYSLTERLLRTSYYPSYARAADSYIPDRAIFVDELIEGKSTSITLSNISTADIPDNVFTKAYVERVSR